MCEIMSQFTDMYKRQALSKKWYHGHPFTFFIDICNLNTDDKMVDPKIHA